MPALPDLILVHARRFDQKSSRHSANKLTRYLPSVPRDILSTIRPFRRIALTPRNQLSRNLSPLKSRKNSLLFTKPFSISRREEQLEYIGRWKPAPTHPTLTEPIQSNTGILTLAILLATISGSVYIFITTSNHSDKLNIESEGLFNSPQTRNNSGSIPFAAMTDNKLPGHVGNLTQEQEEKLQLLWIATLQIFGVLNKEQAKTLSDTVNGIVPTLSGQSALVSEKAKKKKRGWFGKKAKDSEESDIKDIPVPSNDDKYGLASKFVQILDSTSPEMIRSAFWSMLKHDHPDALLLRFLRARKWDVEKALVMMVSTFHWRAVEMHVDDDIMVNGEESMLLDMASEDPVKKRRGADFLEQIRTGKSYLHGVDKAGRPMCFVRVRLHHAGDQLEESLERYTVYVIELARFLVQPPSDTACLVFDMTGFSLANMDYAPVKFMIKCFEANYPESLGVVLIHKAPWVFQGIWKIIRGLLDPVVANKVNFTNSISDMEAFIEKSRIPRDVGGDEDWELKYMEPVIGENDLMKDVETRKKIQTERNNIATEYEKATIAWIENSANEDTITKRSDLRTSLKENYWKIDPYIRARSYYDRAGIIPPGGGIQFYPVIGKISKTPETTQVPTAPHPATASKEAPVETSSDDVD